MYRLEGTQLLDRIFGRFNGKWEILLPYLLQLFRIYYTP